MQPMKAVLSLDVDALRRAQNDPQQFCQDLLRAVMNSRHHQHTFFASGMTAGRVLAVVPMRDTVRVHVNGLMGEIKGEVVVTRTEDGEIVAVTRQDDEGRILEIIAESTRQRT